jgi:predicted nucleotidyltransferase
VAVPETIVESTIPSRFQPAYQRILQLAQADRYHGAFVFGSVARGETTAASDFDVKVVVGEDNRCSHINHTMVGGVKLDSTFGSFAQLNTATQCEIETGERIPMIAESIIVFDKTGDHRLLRQTASQARPKLLNEGDMQHIQFLVYHINDKVERHLDLDPTASLLVMHIGINVLLHFHYQIQRRWWMSSKRLLNDLRQWDATLTALLSRFTATCEVPAKFALWSA